MSLFVNFQRPSFGREPQVTTMAIGEEGGNVDDLQPIRRPPNAGSPPQMTTMAVGEEGGDFYEGISPRPIRPRPPWFPQQPISPWQPPSWSRPQRPPMAWQPPSFPQDSFESWFSSLTNPAIRQRPSYNSLF